MASPLVLEVSIAYQLSNFVSIYPEAGRRIHVFEGGFAQQGNPAEMLHARTFLIAFGPNTSPENSRLQADLSNVRYGSQADVS